MEEIKRLFKNVFTRDVRIVEPTKKGLIVGENLRVYDEVSGPVLSFLEGTDRMARKQITDRFEEQRVSYKVGEDFTN